MKTKLRKMLDLIDEVLAQDTAKAEALWNVLCAMRGPDSGVGDLKERTTVVVRTTAFPRTAKIARDSYGCCNGAQFGASQAVFRIKKADDLSKQGHFLRHVRLAADALGLTDKKKKVKK